MKTKQKPLHSGFNAKSTAMQVIQGIDLTGKIAIVTGGHGGIGLETTRALSSAGAKVVVGARDPNKARQNMAGINNVEIIPLDLASPTSVDNFVAEFLKSHRALDILINNAGVAGPPEIRDARGFDTQFATNHLGHFQLTMGLWDALKKANNARVVALSSIGHMIPGLDLDDLHFEKRPYDKNVSYGQSKTAIALFALHLDKLGEQYGIRAFSVHPGGILTDLARHMSDAERAAWGVVRGEDGKFVAPPGFKNVEQGAATSIWCSTSTLLNGKGGVYCEDCDVAVAVAPDHPGFSGVRPWAMDNDMAAKLWRVSEELVKLPLGLAS